MKRIIKRACIVAAAALMCLALPASSLAQVYAYSTATGGGFWIGEGSCSTVNSSVNTKPEDTYLITGQNSFQTLDTITISGDKTVRFAGVNIRPVTGPAVIIGDNSRVTITLTGDNYFYSADDSAPAIRVGSNCVVSIVEGGVLYATAERYKSAIECGAGSELWIKGGRACVQSTDLTSAVACQTVIATPRTVGNAIWLHQLVVLTVNGAGVNVTQFTPTIPTTAGTTGTSGVSAGSQGGTASSGNKVSVSGTPRLAKLGAPRASAMR